MAKRVRFPLEMDNGVQVNRLEELREHFSLECIMSNYMSGRLIVWLKDRYWDDIAAQIEALDKEQEDFEQKLCEALGVQWQNFDMDLGEKERLSQKKEEQQRIAKAEAERLQKEKAEAERLEKERRETEEKRKAEEERLAKEKEQRETEAKQKAEEERLEKEKALRAFLCTLRLVKTEAERLEKEKAEAERLEKERRETEEKRKTEEEWLAKEKAEADRIERERLEAEQKWKAEEEAVIREDTVRIESLKRRLLSTKKQNERRKMITEFGNPPATLESRLRYDALKEKAEMEKPKEILICRIYGITVLLTFIGFVVSAIINPEISGTAFGMGTAIWAGFGVFIWPIWKIVLWVKSKSKNYYLNIKRI